MAHYNMNLIGKTIDSRRGPKIDNTKNYELTKIADVWKNTIDQDCNLS